MKLHHFGWIVENIETWERNMIHNGKIAEVIDPIQKAKLALYDNFSDSCIELIEPLNESAYTYNSLKNYGSHFHHICYVTDSESKMNEYAQQHRLLKFMGPIPALLFKNQNIYFFINKNKQIIEFVIDEN